MGDFTKAFEYFKKGSLDPRILISVFPEYSQDSSFDEFRRTLKQNFGFESVNELAEKLKAKATTEASKQECTALLRKYLEYVRTTPKISGARKEEVDTCLAKVYARTSASALVDFLKSDNDVSLAHLEPFLVDLKKYSALALLFKSRGESSKALDTWSKLASKQLTDPDFTGLDEAVSFLGSVEEESLIWKHAPWLFVADPSKAVEVTNHTLSPVFDVIRNPNSFFFFFSFFWRTDLFKG